MVLKDICRRLNHHLVITQEAAEKEECLLFPFGGEQVTETFFTISVLAKANAFIPAECRTLAGEKQLCTARRSPVHRRKKPPYRALCCVHL